MKIWNIPVGVSDFGEIRKNGYEEDYDQVLCYGIGFFKKRCRVKKKRGRVMNTQRKLERNAICDEQMCT